MDANKEKEFLELKTKLFNNGIWTKFYTKEEAEKLLDGKIV